MVKWIAAAILLLPFIELGVFALVASALGLAWALALALGTSLAGALVLKATGRGQLVRLRVAAADPDLAVFQAMAGSMLAVLGGVLLLVPGFVTDAIGLVLVLASLRPWIGQAGPRGSHRPGDEVVDLTPEEWERVPDPQIERHRPDDRPPGESRHTPDSRNGSA